VGGVVTAVNQFWPSKCFKLFSLLASGGGGFGSPCLWVARGRGRGWFFGGGPLFFGWLTCFGCRFSPLFFFFGPFFPVCWPPHGNFFFSFPSLRIVFFPQPGWFLCGVCRDQTPPNFWKIVFKLFPWGGFCLNCLFSVSRWIVPSHPLVCPGAPTCFGGPGERRGRGGGGGVSGGRGGKGRGALRRRGGPTFGGGAVYGGLWEAPISCWGEEGG